MCTERKATGLFVLASFLFATMYKNRQNKDLNGSLTIFFFFKISKNSCRNTISLDPDQARKFCRGSGTTSCVPNCLQKAKS